MPGGVHEYMKAWDPEEDTIILQMLDELGPKWSQIVKRLPGRTVSSVRNRWQRIDKGRKLREAGQESKNRCQQCGLPKRGHVCMARLKNRGENGHAAEEALERWHDNTGSDDDDVETDSVSVPYLSRNPSAGSAAGGARPRGGGGACGGEYGAVENAAAPLLSRMKSGPRICKELGFSLGGAGGSFSALAAAAEAVERDSAGEEGRVAPAFFSTLGGASSSSLSSLAAISTSSSHSSAADTEPIEPSVSRMSSTQSAGELPAMPSRMPSLLLAEFANGGGLSCSETLQPPSIDEKPGSALISAALQPPVKPEDALRCAEEGL